MKNIILDTGILLRQPRVLGLDIPDTKFLIPYAIVEELIERTRISGSAFDRRVDLIEKATHQGTVTVLNIEESVIKQFRERFKLAKLSNADISIVSVALRLKSKGEDVSIATLDKDILNFAQDNGIGVLSEVDVNNLTSKFIKSQNENDTIQTEIASYERKEKQSFRNEILVGFCVIIIAFFAYKNIDVIIHTINIWISIIAILFTGIGLFIFREKKKLSYGVFEFFVGVLAIISLFEPRDFDFNKINFNLDFNIKLVGGLYIMVRGQDNIVKAIKDKKIGLLLKDRFGIGG